MVATHLQFIVKRKVNLAVGMLIGTILIALFSGVIKAKSKNLKTQKKNGKTRSFYIKLMKFLR